LLLVLLARSACGMTTAKSVSVKPHARKRGSP
jgi:hypothetical protein